MAYYYSYYGNHPFSEPIAREAFLKKWRELTYINIIKYENDIIKNFNFEKIDAFIFEDTNTAEDFRKGMAFHRRKIVFIAQTLAKEIYSHTNYARNIEQDKIENAINAIRHRTEVKPYPC